MTTLDREKRIKSLQKEVDGIDIGIAKLRDEVAQTPGGHPYLERKILHLNSLCHTRECEIKELTLN
jgi:hypothetical protein